ncbi:MAG: hypothetical protein RLZZ415_126, partial [Pseudomonadota bacterium]
PLGPGDLVHLPAPAEPTRQTIRASVKHGDRLGPVEQL